MADRGQVYLITIVAALLVVGIIGTMSYEQVGEGYIGVEQKFGAITGNTYQPGAHLVAPWITIQSVEIRPRTYTMSDTNGEGNKKSRNDAIQVQSVNGTTHRVDVTIRYHVDPKRADQFVTKWNNVGQAEERLIRPTVRSQMRDEASAIPTSKIYTSAGRRRLADSAKQALEDQFKGEALVLDAVQVRKVSIPTEYQKELNKREVAKAAIKRKQHEVEVEREESKRKQIAAQADARVIEIKGQALRDNPIVLQQRLIDAYGKGTVFVTDGNTPVIMNTGDQSGSGGSSGSSVNASANTTATAVLGGG